MTPTASTPVSVPPRLPNTPGAKPRVLAGLLVACLCTMSAAPAVERPPVSTICVDAQTGLVLQEQNADIRRPPASMVKMMLMLLVTEGIQAGQFNGNTPIKVSKEAQGMGGTQVFLEGGETWPLATLMGAVSVASANDAASAIAESLWGSEAAYARAMNKRALELGMVDTQFRSPHGLPPDKGEAFDMTTARDMALLARACVAHPEIIRATRAKEFRLRPTDKTVKSNTNKLLWRMEDCDGLKTGYINAAGFCIAASAERDGLRLISVVMGSPSKYGRFNLAQELLESGFKHMERVRPLAKGAFVGDEVPIEGGKTSTVRVTATNDVWVHVPQKRMDDLQKVVLFPETLRAPLEAGDTVGKAKLLLDGIELGATKLVVPVAVPAAGWRLVLEHGAARWEGLDGATAEYEN